MGRKKKGSSAHTIADKLEQVIDQSNNQSSPNNNKPSPNNQSNNKYNKEANNQSSKDWKEGSSPTTVTFADEAKQTANIQSNKQSIKQSTIQSTNQPINQSSNKQSNGKTSNMTSKQSNKQPTNHKYTSSGDDDCDLPVDEIDEIEADEHDKPVKRSINQTNNQSANQQKNKQSSNQTNRQPAPQLARSDSVRSVDLDGSRSSINQSWYRATYESIKHLSWNGVALIAVLLSLLSFILHLVAGSTMFSQSINQSINQAINMIALLAGAISVPLIHGLAGTRKFNRSHNQSSKEGKKVSNSQPLDQSPNQSTRSLSRSAKKEEPAPAAEYHFFQPLEGGSRYIALQIIGWIFYTFFLIFGMYLLFFGVKNFAVFIRGGVGITGLLANISVLGSLHFYANASHDALKRSSNLSVDQTAHRDDNRSEPYERAANERAIFQTKNEKKNEKRRKQAQLKSVDQSVEPDEPRVWAALATNSGRAGLIVTVASVILALIIESMRSFNQSASHANSQSIYQLLISSLILGVPLTHIMTGRKIHPKYSLFQPFQGGWAFVLLQALGWTLWTIAVLLSVSSIFLSQSVNQSINHTIGFNLFGRHDQEESKTLSQHLISGAGVGGVISQALVLLSLKYFDARLTHRVARAGNDRRVERVYSQRNLFSQTQNQGIVGKIHQTINERINPSIVLGSSQRDLFRAISESKEQEEEPTKQSIKQSVKQSVTDLPTDKLEAAYNAQYGTINQSINQRHNVPLNELRQQLAMNRRFTVSSRRLYDYASMELLTKGIETVNPSNVQSSLISLSLTQWKEAIGQFFDQLSINWITDCLLTARDTLIIFTMYFIPILGAVFAFTPFVILYFFSHIWWVPYFVGVCVAGYMTTFRGRPGFTGHRSWEFWRANKVLWSAFESYFSANIIAHGSIDITQGPYIFGFHPHGVYPLTTFWSTRGPSFRAAYPGLDVDVCGASVMFSCPILREILLWSGGREVSAAAIRHALHAQRSILLVPGGQREMLHSQPSHRVLTIVTKHKGFVRIACETGSSLVPILSLGETFPLSNVPLPRLQSWFLENTGVGWPVFPYGRWYSPIGRPFPITVIIGEPIVVPKVEEPDQAFIDEIHTKYYDSVRQLFEKYKAEAGFPNQTLVFSDV